MVIVSYFSICLNVVKWCIRYIIFIKLLQQFSSDKIPKATNYNVIIFNNPSYTIFNLFVIRFLFFFYRFFHHFLNDLFRFQSRNKY